MPEHFQQQQFLQHRKACLRCLQHRSCLASQVNIMHMPYAPGFMMLWLQQPLTCHSLVKGDNAIFHAGVIPFVALSPPIANALPMMPADIVANAALLQLTYGASIASFLGGVHWSLAMVNFTGRHNLVCMCLNGRSNSIVLPLQGCMLDHIVQVCACAESSKQCLIVAPFHSGL